MVVALGVAGGMLSVSSPSDAGSMPERRAPMLVPKADHEALRAGIYAAFPRAEGRWGAVHVVDRACTLSRAVIAHLVERRATPEIDELVVVIDAEGATRREDIELVHAGYRVRIVAEARGGEVIPVATPAMVVARPDGVLAYVGGYGEEQRGCKACGYGRDEIHAVGYGRDASQPEIHDVGYGRDAIHAVGYGRDASQPEIHDVVRERFADSAILRELIAVGETRYSLPVVGCSASRAGHR
ncbi:MAG: hypothetical protein ACKV2T_25695 [Kofleriaceae bacterium]